MDVMSPVVAATECIPSKKAKASTGLILKTKGIIKAKVAAPPIPGSKPTHEPQTHADHHQAESLPLQN